MTLILPLAVSFLFADIAYSGNYHSYNLDDPYAIQEVSVDSIPINDRFGDFISDDERNPFDLDDPNIIKKEVEYDPISNSYLITERIGDEYYRASTYMTFQEYVKWKQEKQQRAYFATLAGLSRDDGGFNKRGDPLDRIDVSFNLVDRLFGGSVVDMRPQGNIELTFGLDFQTNENPSVTADQQKTGGFDFDMAIQMNLAGKIGTKLTMDVNYNTQSSFDFDRVLKIRYDASSLDPSRLLSNGVRDAKQQLSKNARDRIVGNTGDEIIKKIEAGNVSLPLRNSLIQGSQNLFGIKTELQFGKLRTTLLASQQKSEQQQLKLQGGAEVQEFEVRADQYDENRHFFLSHYNRNTFEESLRDIPQVNTQFRLTKIEVWVTNDRLDIQDDRDIVLLADLGEFEIDELGTASPELIRILGIRNSDITGTYELPSNDANLLYRRLLQGPRDLSSINPFLIGTLGMQQSRDFEKVRARLLSSTEYTVNNDLGFISLNITTRPNQIVGVAYEYTYNGQVFQVGEFANEVPENPENPGVHFVKMLKSTIARVDLPIWDLMMKNIYGIGAFQVTNEDFQLDFFYEDVGLEESIDRRNLPNTNVENKNLIEVFNLDNLNFQRDPQPDGLFDFISGLTINVRTGRIMIPLLEPFGSSLIDILDDDVEDLYAFPQLYDSTVTVARDFTELNRFLIKGKYKSSISSDISLGAFNIPRGSVRVTAGGTRLTEGVDYEVDYNVGRVKILNDAYTQSGIPVNVSFEDNSLFSFQTKTMLGMRADYEVSENLNIGGTYLRLFERPFTQKVNIGEDPINNRVFGLDVNYSNQAPWLTRIVDKIPLINTKEESSISFSAEAAALDPGHSSAINGIEDEGGVVYVDDFEGSASRIDLFTNPIAWTLASVPTDLSNGAKRFRESDLTNDLATGVNRAALSWYRADRFVISAAERNNVGGLFPYCRPLILTELFETSVANLFEQDLRTFDLNYRPAERGPYNYDIPNGTGFSAGADVDGDQVVLEDPSSRWGGIMRSIPSNTDFEASNVEFLEFWVLNPYIDKPNNATGKLIIQLGNISEDIQKDSRFFFENGLPEAVGSSVRTSTTEYGIVPISQPIVNAFDNDPESRELQDVGFDGLSDFQEKEFFQDYLNKFGTNEPIVARDPSNDNFVFYNDPIYQGNSEITCTERYSRHNFPDGDSPIPTSGATTTQSQKSTPDIEDLDRDNTLNESESYFQYEVQLVNQNGLLTSNRTSDEPEIITDQRAVAAYNSPGRDDDGIWYRFRIPLRSPDQVVGGIRDFRAIRFIRMYMTEFEEPVTLRFARLELTRSQWRRYELFEECDGDLGGGNIEIDAVNFEENNRREPFNYVLPEGIMREQAFGALQTTLQNEQSLSLKTCNLPAGCDVGAYKIIDFDFRLYERLKMFIHAESDDLNTSVSDGDVELFIRIGSDLSSNYYEIVKPLKLSDLDAGRDDPLNVWPVDNNIDVALQDLIDLKTGRANPSDSIAVVGLPNLADAKNIMIGIRSTSSSTSNQCIEIWANELRVTGLDEDGGIAALARMEMQMADFGTLAASFNYSSVGYGGIDQPLVLRNREDIMGFDFSTNLELGKFLPKSSGVRIPFYAQRSVTKSSPQYDPFDEDVELSVKKETADDPQMIQERAEDYTSLTTFNFTNVRKERTNSKKPKPWDIENISVSYSNTKESRHDPIILQNDVNTRRIGLTYNYSRPNNFIKPFGKLIKSKKFLNLIKEFNFNPLPNNFAFNTNLDRRFGETRFRSVENRRYFNKYYTWARSYTLGWDLAKSLKINYNAVNYAVVDEPDENVLLEQFPDDEKRRNEVRSDSIWSSLKSFGRPKAFNHNLDISYTLPFKHIPYLDFINARAQYSAGYNWDAASQNVKFLGNSIQNSQRRQLNTTLDFRKLYRKIDYLKKIQQKPRKKDNKKKGDLKDVKDDGRKGKKGKVKKELIDKDSPNKEIDKKLPADLGKDQSKEKKKEGPREISTAERILVRPLLSLRQVRFTYSRDLRSYVPGFTPDPEYFGLGEELTAPGIGYILGVQPDREWLFNAAINEGWITESGEQNQQFLLEDRENYELKISLEPFRDFSIDLSWSKTDRNTHTEIFKRINGNEWVANNPRDIGSYTISYFAANTLFGRDINSLFQDFSDNRTIVSNRLGALNGITDTHDADGVLYREGYGRVQNDVVIPSFIAAYTDTDPNQVDLDVLKINPKPNWTLRWNGLTSIGFIGKYFSNFSLTHGYSSGLNINSFNSNFDYVQDQQLIFTNENKNQITQNFFSVLDIPSVEIQESFSPLLGINLTTKTGATLRFDYKKSRNLQLNLRESGELTEAKTTDFTFGFGHKIRNVNIGFLQIDGTGEKARARKKRKKEKEREKKKDDRLNKDLDKKSRKKQKKVGGSDLNIQVDISFRDDRRVVHELDSGVDAVDARGTKTLRISPALDYDINKNLNFRFFVDYSSTDPYVSSSFRTTTTRGGVNLRFKLN